MINLPNFSLYLIRHAESEVNVQPDLMGQSADIKLTSNGKYQAKLLNNRVECGEFGKIDFIYSSPYKRTVDTAKIACPKRQIIFADELREYDAGDWTASKRSETITDEVRLNMGYLNMGFLPPHGESQNMVERRASEWLERTILYFDYRGQNINQALSKDHLDIVAFSHGMTIKSLLHYVMGFDKSFLWKIEIDNTSVTKLTFGRTGWRLNYVNDTSHLR